jgi:tRNA pseudouridine38-40 synthase
LIASGRTDSGVHALGQVANFKTNSNIRLEKLQRALNGLLPEDICISKAEEKPLEFHSRFDAKSKLYRYMILNRAYPSALMRNTAYFYPFPLDVRLMQREAKALLGRHNFGAFCASGSSAKDTTRTIKNITIKKSAFRLSPLTFNLNERPLIIIDIEADGFLYNMVRNIAGTLIEIGRGRFKKGYLGRILRSMNRKNAGPTSPAHGLCLVEVKY